MEEVRDMAVILESLTDGAIVSFNGRGFFVPNGLTAEEIEAGGRELWELLEIPRMRAEALARAVLKAALRARAGRSGIGECAT